ncbi:MAG: SPOR domain-containing protein [Tepidisphaeraceae bacterium]
MRNCDTTSLSIIFLACGILVGCADQSAKQNLSAGYQSLQAGQFDDALARADAQIKAGAHAPGTAEALYLRGRTLEQRTKSDPAQGKSDLAGARDAYTQALRLSPNQPLESYIRASLGNVAYWQDDYATAEQQWIEAYGKIPGDDVNAFILYRIGLAQQRQGNFTHADATFAKVQQQAPNTEAAERARSHSGYRAFTVQVATFASPQSADAAIATLRRSGAIPTRQTNSRGQLVISIGPASTYPQAQALKDRFASSYPDAIIVP